MSRWLLALTLAVVWGAVCPRGQAAEFTPAQRAEIVSILRDALKQDPSILRDAVIALQADDNAKGDEVCQGGHRQFAG